MKRGSGMPVGLGGTRLMPNPVKRKHYSNRLVKCADCNAEVGAPCTKADGTPKPGSHPVRVRMSIRHSNQSL